MRHSNVAVSRRRMMGGIGALLAGGSTMLAGCVGSGASSSGGRIGPVYESASVGSASDGEGGTNPIFDTGDLELLGATLSMEGGIIAVRGSLRNIGTFTFDNVRVEAQFLDASDAIISQSLAVVQDLAPEQTWRFEVPYPDGDHDAVAAAIITDIVSY